MYNKLMNLNMINKILFLIAFVVAAIFVNNLYFIILIIAVLFIMSVITGIFKATDTVVIAIVLMFFRDYYVALDVLFRVLLASSVILVFIGLLRNVDKANMLESTFYKGSKDSRRITKLLYTKKVEGINGEKYSFLKNILKPYKRYAVYVDKEREAKTNRDINDMHLYSKLRFYGHYRKKKSSSTFSWSNFDNTMLLLNIMVIVLFFIWG